MTYQRDVRLGIVLYGGVSLAVYENGVAQELHRAIRGDGVYELLKVLIDSNIVVDIISGTSAGGVNGIMLGYALANGLAFAPSADLWREQGDINKLLRAENDPNTASVLDSDYYSDKLEECFAKKLFKDKYAPAIEELDVFITGTDANGDIYTIYDDQGHAIDVKNHRAVFKLEVRKEGRKNDFQLAAPKDLAKLARITSCFPVAFQPVTIDETDDKFFRWGKLRKPAVYLDGGILNNKPFTSTIDAISRRMAEREVERLLIYVEPDPEVFTEGGSQVPESPTVLKAALTSLISIPGYQSIAADLEAIEAHNEVAGRIAEIFDRIPEAKQGTEDCVDKASVLLTPNDSFDSTAYIVSRFIQLRDMAVGSILNDKKGRAYISSLDDRRSGRILVKSFDEWNGDANATLLNFDIFFRLRRASHLSQMLMRRAKARQPIPGIAWEVVNHFFKLYEIAEWSMIEWLNHWDYNWRALGPKYPDLDTQPKEVQAKTLAKISMEVWTLAEERMIRLIETPVTLGAALTPEKLSAERTSFYDEITAACGKNPPAPVAGSNLLRALDDALKAALRELDGDTGRMLRNEFCRFVEVDRQLFPLQLGSNFESTSVVRVVRFSPHDAQRGSSKGAVAEKVCGSALGAFGGFFKKSWRANDIMMGRFDASCLLVECMLTKERLAVLPANRTVTVSQIAGWFKNIGAGAATLTDTINTYLKDPTAATKESWNNLVDQIVVACHKEIELEEWPRVQRSALQQEYAWDRYRANTKAPHVPFDVKNLVWKRGKAKPDQVLVQVAANAITSGALTPFTPGAVAGGRFLDELPDTVLQELAFLATIRMGNSLLASVKDDKKRERVRKNSFYRWPFGTVLPIFYRWARIRRTQPETVVIFNTVIPVLCMSVLLVSLALFVFGATLPKQLWSALVGPPLALLLVWCYLFRK